MKILARLFRRAEQQPDPDELLNSALDVALDFDNWLSPIQSRLQARQPSLDTAQLDALNATCNEAILFGQQTALNLSRAAEQLLTAQDRFNALFVARYPWVTPANLERAYRHCIYYATKTTRVS